MTLNDQLENFAITQDVAKEARKSNDEMKRLDRRISELEQALRPITMAAKSWHDFHHSSKDIQCDAICEALPAALKALASR
jgi:hypothetical protein